MKNIRIISFILALLMTFGLLSGCTADEINSAIDTANQIIDIADQILSETDGTVQTETQTAQNPQPDSAAQTQETAAIDEDGVYTSRDDVALYIHTYGHLPSNYVTKSQAEAAGWSGGSLEKYLPGKCIGGNRFGNREGILPDAPGRTWTECDINTLGAKSRGAERIVFSNDGLIYYTGDHYESFELLYGNP